MALTNRKVPSEARIRVKPADFQSASFLGMRARLVAAARKGGGGGLDAPNASFGVEGLRRPCRIRGWADDDEVVVHHVVAPDSVAFFHEGRLLLRRVDEEHIGIAAPPDARGPAPCRPPRRPRGSRTVTRSPAEWLEEPRVHGGWSSWQLQDCRPGSGLQAAPPADVICAVARAIRMEKPARTRASAMRTSSRLSS